MTCRGHDEGHEAGHGHDVDGGTDPQFPRRAVGVLGGAKANVVDDECGDEEKAC